MSSVAKVLREVRAFLARMNIKAPWKYTGIVSSFEYQDYRLPAETYRTPSPASGKQKLIIPDSEPEHVLDIGYHNRKFVETEGDVQSGVTAQQKLEGIPFMKTAATPDNPAMYVGMPVTSVYSGLLGAIYVVLAARVGQIRSAKRVSIGDGNDPLLAHAIRGHGNFQEYVPLFLILLGLVEIQRAVPAIVLHLVAATFVVGRLLHAVHFCWQGPRKFRFLGMQLTVGPLVIDACALLFHTCYHSFSLH